MVARNECLFSAPFKAKQSTLKGSQVAGMLFNIHLDDAIKATEMRLKMQMLIANDLKIRINIHALSIIISITLFFHDAKIITDCTFKLE